MQEEDAVIDCPVCALKHLETPMEYQSTIDGMEGELSEMYKCSVCQSTLAVVVAGVEEDEEEA